MNASFRHCLPLASATGRRKCHGCDELRFLSSASGPNGEFRRSRADRARAEVLAASPVAPVGTEGTSQCRIRGREMDPGRRQCKCPECSEGRPDLNAQHAAVCPIANVRHLNLNKVREDRKHLFKKNDVVVGFFVVEADVITRRNNLTW